MFIEGRQNIVRVTKGWRSRFRNWCAAAEMKKPFTSGAGKVVGRLATPTEYPISFIRCQIGLTALPSAGTSGRLNSVLQSSEPFAFGLS